MLQLNNSCFEYTVLFFNNGEKQSYEEFHYMCVN